MKTYSDTGMNSLTAVMRATVRVAVLAAVFLVAVFRMGAEWDVYADDAALTVKKDGQTVKEFTMTELEELAAEEGDLSYDYSAWNVNPTFSEIKGVRGPTVEAVFESSGVRETITDSCTITFRAADGYKKILTGKQLFEEKRYYFPNGDLVDQANGVIPDEAYSDAVEVPAVISTQPEQNYKCRVCIGQAAPNEENNPLFVDRMADGGVIEISSDPAPKCKPVQADPAAGSTWRAGKKIRFTSENDYSYDKIYFAYGRTSRPDYGSAIFNCGPRSDLECSPVISEQYAEENSSKIYISTVVKGYGKQDSDVQRFSYTIGDALTVKVDGKAIKSYDPDEISEIDDTETDDLSYSGYNSYPTFEIKRIRNAVKVERIIEDATGHKTGYYNRNYQISFSDGTYSSVFTFGQLFGTERFYYPDAKNGTDEKGGAAKEKAYKGAKKVPVVIDLEGDNALMFGQAAPNEQNYPEFVKYMMSGGIIEITTKEADKCDPVRGVSPPGGSIVKKGTQIDFDLTDRKNNRNKEYYVIDPAKGELPGPGCAFYFYSPYNWEKKLTNSPVIASAGKHTLAVKVCAYGKQDSDVSYFKYTVLPDPPSRPAVKLTAGKRKITLRWKKVKGADGYVIYRSTKKSSSYKPVRTIKKGSTVSFTNSKLKKGKRYYYKVRAYKKAYGKKVFSRYSSVKSAKAK